MNGKNNQRLTLPSIFIELSISFPQCQAGARFDRNACNLIHEAQISNDQISNFKSFLKYILNGLIKN